MPDGTVILVLLAVCVLFFLFALLFRRRPGASAATDPATRYRRARNLCVAYGMLFALETVVAIGRRDGSLFGKLFVPGCFALCLAVFLVQFLKARREFQKLPALLQRQSKRSLPAFFWQAILILLPVTLMAGFGFWAIRQQRRAVEQDAQQRAKDILRGLPDAFGRLAANRLTEYDAYKQGWLDFMESGVTAWPGGKIRRQILDDTNELNIISKARTALKEAFPDWPSGVPPIADFILDTNGEPAWQTSLPPHPPDWLLALSAAQREAWTALAAADLTGAETSRLVERAAAFEQTKPPKEATACANFILLREQLRAAPATNAVQRLLDFASRHDRVESETGVALRSLALAEAIRRSRECGPTEALWEALRTEAVRAGVLAPQLLDTEAALVADNPELSNSVAAMKVCLAERQLRRELAAALAQSGFRGETATTNVWVSAMSQRWFCLVQPNEVRGGTIISNQAVWTTNFYPEARCFPQTLVARAFAGALTQARVSLPTYFSLTLQLEGERVPLSSPWSRLGGGQPSGDILAEENFEMSEPAIMRQENPNTGQREKIPFEAMPGHPHFFLRVLLTDRRLLYARQRQLQLTFGALIAVSALTALIGFVAAYRAFHREQQLNELKTNFVSSVSHELRAPIASVRLMAENLARGKIPGPAKQGEYFRFIVQECRRLSSLIENVLDFSRIEQGRKQYEFEPTNLVALAETTVKLMEPYAAEKGVALTLETSSLQPPTPGIELNVDGRAIQQALVNLMDNAIKHSSKGGVVTVGIESGAGVLPAQRTLQREQFFTPTPAARTGKMPVLLYVADHGPGIPAAEHEKIFERFYRRGSELRRETPGVGIGLSVVKHIVEAHGGCVRVESEVGQGSRFTIELPIKAEQPRMNADGHR